MISFAYASYPEFEFDTTSYESGAVDVMFSASSGTKVDFFINDNFIGSQSVFADSNIVELDGSEIQNEEVIVFSKIIFTNIDPSSVYIINISSGPYKKLLYGQSLEFAPTVVEDILYTNEETGVSRTISVIDELVDVYFNNSGYNTNDYMGDGLNIFKFIQSYPATSYPMKEEFLFNVDFNKFSNVITLVNTTKISSDRSAYFAGYVSDSRYPLYYSVNIAPSEISNLAGLTKINLDGVNFEAKLSNLREGNNTIYFLSVDNVQTDVFSGEEIDYVIVDTVDPVINIVEALYKPSDSSFDLRADFSDSDVFINAKRLSLEIVTDSVVLNYTFNAKNYSEDVDEGNVTIDLSLNEGQNNLTLTAIDAAGNFNKVQHNIYYSGTKPDIIKDSLSPSEMFDGNTAHFFFEEISGKTTVPDVELTIFTIPPKATTIDDVSVDCDNFEFLVAQNLGQLDNDRVDSSELNMNETQVSLLNIVLQKQTVTSGSDGSFDAIVTFKEDSFDTKDVKDDNSQIDDVRSQNIVCFVMKDKYGNYDVYEERIYLDAGNTMWKQSEITSIPNTMYASEIENTGDSRSDNGNAEFGMIVNFEYVGPGKVTNLDSLKIREDSDLNSGAKFSLDSSRMNFKLDKDSGDLIVYIPVIVLEQGVEPLDYPDTLDFNFQADVKYQVDSVDIPIDEANPIYFKATINIESPLDSTKWLTPKMIEKWQGYLNKTIEFTQTSTEYMKFAAIGGTLSCTSAKFYYTYLMSMKEPGSVEYNNYQRRLFMICDRVACTPSPSKCSVKRGDANGYVTAPEGVNVDGTSKFLKKDSFGDSMDYVDTETGMVLGEYQEMRFLGYCEMSDGSDGVYVEGTLLAYEEEVSQFSSNVATIKSTKKIRKTCVPATYDEVNTQDPNDVRGDFKSFNAEQISSVCYNPGTPSFDDTRCNIAGLNPFNGDAEGYPLEGRDSSGSIISSIACGCITDTYSHLKSWLVIQQGIYQCLEQAKIGDIKGGYCERLMGQAVCDIATNVVLPEVQRSMSTPRVSSRTGDDTHQTQNFLQSMRETDNVMNSRYDGTFLDKAGLSTDQILNKACVGAISGDWSILTDNVLSAIDQNEVDPIFGPPLPESRQQGYNPITGELSIRYSFTHAAVSGGQSIRMTYEFVCDKSKSGGEYCPSSRVISAEDVSNSDLGSKTLTISAGSSAQDNIVMYDAGAKYWYNVLKVRYVYEVKGEKKDYTEEFKITHKSETLLASCYWSAGTIPTDVSMSFGEGIVCENIFDEDAIISAYSIDKSRSSLVPSKQASATYYTGNKVFVDLAYDISASSENLQNEFVLAYMATCKGTGDNNVVLGNDGQSAPHFQSISTSALNLGGRAILETYTLPSSLGKSDGGYTAIAKGVSLVKDKRYAIKVTALSGIASPTFSIKSISLGTANLQIVDNYIGQKLTVNTEDVDNKYILIKLKPSTVSQTKDIKIEFDGEATGIALQVVEIVDGNPGSSLGGFLFESVQVAAGLCSLDMRIIPKSDEDALTIENFKTYSSLNDNSGESSIQVDDSLASDLIGVVTKTFNIQEASSSKIYFEMLYPKDSSSICLEVSGSSVGDSITVPLVYVLQDSMNGDFPGVDISYSLDAGIYGTLMSGNLDIPTQKNRLKKTYVTINLNDNVAFKEALETKLGDISTDISDRISSWVFGSGTGLSGTLTYTIEKKACAKDKIINIKEETKSIPVEFVISGVCPDFKVDGKDGNADVDGGDRGGEG